MANSINTNVAAYFAQSNIANASNQSASSVARLSSGNRIVKSSDDVAALSIGTSLQTGVSALKVALTNASQGNSLLQVADGGLSQITSILQRQKAIALQAGSGSLTDNDRSFLQIEFSELSQQVDKIVNSTTFNGVKLLDGSLSTTASVADSTALSTAGGQRISFTSTIRQGQTVTINGTTLTAGTSNSSAGSGTRTFKVGGTLAETVSNLATALNNIAGDVNNNATLGDASYASDGSTLVITARSGGKLSNTFTISNGAAVSATLGDQAIVFTSGSATASITQTGHGYSAGDTITLTGQSGAAVSNLFGTYQITSVTDANTYTITLKQAASAVGIAASLSTTNGSASTTIAYANADQYFSAGQSITLAGGSVTNFASAASVTGTFTIASVSSTGITFTAGANATATGTGDGGAALTMFVNNSADNGGNTAIKVSTSSATTLRNSDSSGSSVGSSFNLFGVTTGLTSATQIVSDSATTTARPFRDGDTITATVNGVTKTLHTIGTQDTLTGIVNGINANSSTTGFSAALTVDENGEYNVRLNYAGEAGIILLNGGTNFGADAVEVNTLAGNAVSSTSNLLGATGSISSVYATGYIDVMSTAAINANNTITAVTAVTPSATSAPFRIGDSLTVNINGNETVLHTFGTSDTLNSIVNSINADTASTGVYAAITGSANAYNIRLYVANASTGNSATDAVSVSAGAGLNGTIGGNTNVTVNKASRLTADTSLTQVSTAQLYGGTDNGIGQGQTIVTGSVGDSILADLGTTKANASVLFTSNAVANEYITVGGQKFVFTSNSNRAANEILIGSTVQETVNNAVSALKRYVADGYALGTTGYEMGQMDITATSNSLVFTAKGLDAVKTLTGGNSAITENLSNGALVGGTLNNNSSTFGVDVTGISNADFVGKISGFEAEYTGTTDTVNLSVKIGDDTYTADNVDMTVTSDTRIRFLSDSNGGYFDVQLKANQVLSFSNQAGADTVADRLNSAFSSLSFIQKHAISSYNGSGSIVTDETVTGSLVGTSVSAQLKSFDKLSLSDVQILAPSGSILDAKVTLKVNGVEFSTASGIGSSLGANQTYRLTSVNDANEYFEFTTGNSAIDLSTDAKAASAEAAIKAAFGSVDGASGLSFQIGTTAEDSLEVSLGSAKVDDLFGGETLSVTSQSKAQAASLVLDDALAQITSLRAKVGALQSRFNYASANIQASVQNQDAARGELLDTDIASESTSYATSQVKLQAGISVLAQANQQLQALLKLIG